MEKSYLGGSIVWKQADVMVTNPRPQKGDNMGARPATIIESVLGVEKAKECLAEIKARQHVLDTKYFREELRKEVITRYVQKQDLTLKEVDNILSLIDKGNESCTKRVVNIIADAVYEDEFLKPYRKESKSD